MAITGLRPSQLDADTVNALKSKLEIHSYDEIGDALSPITYGQGLVNIRRKLNGMIVYGKPASSIRIALMADSIFAGGLKQPIVDFFHNTYGVPVENIDVDCCWGGYESSFFLPCLDNVVIKPNVDLFIFSENEDVLLDQMVAKVRAKTNADIMFGTWSLNESTGFPRYHRLIEIAKKYNCELFDLNGLLLRKYTDGTYLTYMASQNNVHLSAAGYTYILADFYKHFQSPRYYNEYVNPDSIREEVIFLGAEKLIPVRSYITFSGTWIVGGTYPTISKGNYIRSNSIGDYIEITFTGIGFEVLFGASASENNHNILIDGVASSTSALEYCTQIIGKTQTDSIWYFHRLFVAQVTAPFMTNDESEVEFEITIDSITRDVNSKITSMGYTLRQGTTVLGAGDVNTTSTFTFRTTGQITIPASLFDAPNYIELNGYLFNVGDTMKFFARKTWKDSINTNTETFLRVSGLTRGEHTLRITKASAVDTDINYISLYK